MEINGIFLRRLRLRDGISQQKLAGRINLPITTIREWEKEAHNVEDHEIHLYCSGMTEQTTFEDAMTYFEYVAGIDTGILDASVQILNSEKESEVILPPGKLTITTPIEEVGSHKGNKIKLTYHVGRSVQLEMGEWERVDVGLEQDIDSIFDYREYVDNMIVLCRSTLRSEIAKSLTSTGQSFGFKEEKSVSGSQESGEPTSEGASGGISDSSRQKSNHPPTEWDFNPR